jgi:hypothetical protein
MKHNKGEEEITDSLFDFKTIIREPFNYKHEIWIRNRNAHYCHLLHLIQV